VTEITFICLNDGRHLPLRGLKF